jgi:hypothetical protein
MLNIDREMQGKINCINYIKRFIEIWSHTHVARLFLFLACILTDNIPIA